MCMRLQNAKRRGMGKEFSSGRPVGRTSGSSIGRDGDEDWYGNRSPYTSEFLVL
jgi:hypothetical protein